MAEPGFWTVTDAEAAAFRAYLLKGGFVIFDDFAEQRGGWGAFEAPFRQGAARGAVRRSRRHAPDLPFLLRDRFV